jgi:streptomycin 3"-adenylyltransferase
MAHASGWALFGPPPGQVLDPVPAVDVRRACVDAVPGLLGDLGTDTTNVLLTLARCWSTVDTGAIRSKDEAADWAAARASGELRDVLVRARDDYRGLVDAPWADVPSRLPALALVLAGHVTGRTPGADA